MFLLYPRLRNWANLHQHFEEKINKLGKVHCYNVINLT